MTRKRLFNPSNTLNRYIYAGNNPALYVDHTGQDITVYYRALHGLGDFGHILLAVTNQATGQVRFVDYYPATPTGDKSHLWQEEAGGLHLVDSQRLSEHAALTIRTTAEVAEMLITKIDELAKTPGGYNFLKNNCAEVCADLLKSAGFNLIRTGTPQGLWAQLYAKYSAETITGRHANSQYQPGKD